jgi:polyisoprenoid-binding protein YceI
MRIAKSVNPVKYAFLALVLYAPCNVAAAQYELVNAESSINFVSTKNNSVAEIHSFGSLVGFISAEGKVQVGIDLDSVETSIDIRNERMREILFETAKFPTANISAQVDAQTLKAVAEGGHVTADVELTVSLHGMEQTLNTTLVASIEEGDILRVYSPAPILLNVSGFGLESGVEALREIAGLKAISIAIPVTVNLVFSLTE